MLNFSRASLLAALIACPLACTLPACTSARPDTVPAAAIESGSGKGDVTWVASKSGTAYVYNQTWHQLIYSGPVERGQQIKVDTLAGRVLVNNQVVTEHTLGNDDQFSIYLDSTIADQRHDNWRDEHARD